MILKEIATFNEWEDKKESHRGYSKETLRTHHPSSPSADYWSLAVAMARPSQYIGLGHSQHSWTDFVRRNQSTWE